MFISTQTSTFTGKKVNKQTNKQVNRTKQTTKTHASRFVTKDRQRLTVLDVDWQIIPHSRSVWRSFILSFRFGEVSANWKATEGLWDSSETASRGMHRNEFPQADCGADWTLQCRQYFVLNAFGSWQPVEYPQGRLYVIFSRYYCWRLLQQHSQRREDDLVGGGNAGRVTLKSGIVMRTDYTNGNNDIDTLTPFVLYVCGCWKCAHCGDKTLPGLDLR